MTQKIRILVVDDHEVVRQGLRLSLELEPDIEVVGEARTGAEAEALVRALKPDIVLLDAKLEDIDGPVVCQQILEASRETSILMLSSYQHDDLVFRSLKAGAKGYVLKDVEIAELKKMIRSVYRGYSVLDPKVTDKVISNLAAGGGMGRPATSDFERPTSSLSETDLKILRYLSEGFTNKRISLEVNLSPHTVKDHIEKMFDIYDVRSRIGLVTEAFKRGLI